MIKVLSFILSSIIEFIKMLFTIDLGNGFNLGLLMCLCFIFLPMMLRIINFIKQDAIEELDDKFDYERRNTSKVGYIGKHEEVGRHSKQYFARQREAKRWSK